MRIEYIVVHKM